MVLCTGHEKILRVVQTPSLPTWWILLFLLCACISFFSLIFFIHYILSMFSTPLTPTRSSYLPTHTISFSCSLPKTKTKQKMIIKANQWDKKKMSKQAYNNNKTSWCSFCVSHPLLGTGPVLSRSVVDIPRETPLQKTDLLFASRQPLPIVSWLGMNFTMLRCHCEYRTLKWFKLSL